MSRDPGAPPWPHPQHLLHGGVRSVCYSTIRRKQPFGSKLSTLTHGGRAGHEWGRRVRSASTCTMNRLSGASLSVGSPTNVLWPVAAPSPTTWTPRGQRPPSTPSKDGEVGASPPANHPGWQEVLKLSRTGANPQPSVWVFKGLGGTITENKIKNPQPHLFWWKLGGGGPPPELPALDSSENHSSDPDCNLRQPWWGVGDDSGSHA